LAGILANAGQPLLEALELQHTPTYEKLSREQNVLAFELKERLKKQYKDINESVKYANTALPQEIVENILLDVIISNRDENI